MNFFRRYQKLFYIIIFLGISVLIGYFIWSLFFKSPEIKLTTSPDDGTIAGFPDSATGTQNIIDRIVDGDLPSNINIPLQPQPSILSPVASGGLTKTEKLSQDRALNPSLSSDGKVQYYNWLDGKFYKIDKSGKAIALSDRVFKGVENVTWSPGKDKAILEYPDGRKILYNFSTEKQASIPSHWEDFSFSPDSTKLTSKSIGLDPSNSWLVISNDDGSKAKAIEEIGLNHPSVYPNWSPSQQIVGVYTQGLDFNRQEVFFIGQNQENFKSTIIEGRGLEFQWSSEGDRLLYSVWNSDDGLRPRLWIVNASTDSIGTKRTNLNIATWSNKCSFATNSEIYCAVPESLPEGAGLFPEVADDIRDLIYKIDLKTGAKKLLAIPDGEFSIGQIMVPSDQKTLFFTNKKSNELYKIDL